jgi:gliding motility associated protien GldN
MEKRIGVLLTLILLFTNCIAVSAQVTEVLPQTQTSDTFDDTTKQVMVDSASFDDGFYRLNAHENAKPYAFPKVDRNNVIFFKRIWRDIDVTDSMNHIFATPGKTLMEAITEGIKSGQITAFDPVATEKNPTGDAFVTPLTPAAAIGKLTDSVLVPMFDDEGNEIGSEMRMNDFNPLSISKFRIKEDIFLDKQRSRIETRIIGIAPVISINVADAQIAEQPAFWIYFPQARAVLATKEVMDTKRGISKQSMDDIFIQHRFVSNIIKESNPGELSIQDYSEDREQESKRIEKEIAEYKKSFWKYK